MVVVDFDTLHRTHPSRITARELISSKATVTVASPRPLLLLRELCALPDLGSAHIAATHGAYRLITGTYSL